MTARLSLVVPLPLDVAPDPEGFDRRATADRLRDEVPGLTHAQVVALVEREAARARTDQPADTPPAGWAPNAVDLDPDACLWAVNLDRWHRRVEVDETTGCHLWTGDRAAAGYGRVTVAGRTVAAHRVAYTAANGPIPAGWEVDHVCHSTDPDCPAGADCRHRRCVNPAHLEAVDPVTHNGRTHVARVRCPRGHDLTDPANLSPSDLARGWRTCRICGDERRAAVSAAHRRLGLTQAAYAALFGLSRRVAEQIAGGADPLPLVSRGADPDAVAHLTQRLTSNPLPLTLGDPA